MRRRIGGNWACATLLCLGCGRTTLNAQGVADSVPSDCNTGDVCTDGVDVTGRLLRGEHFESTDEVSIRDIAASSDGRVGMGGYYKGKLRSGKALLAVAETATEDGFVAVYAAQGREQWAIPVTGFGAQGVTGVAFAPNGDLATQGFSDQKRDALVGTPAGVAFVIRFDTRGEVNVRKGFSGGQTFAAKVAVDSTGAWIAVGSFTGQFDFYGLQPTLPPYVVKLDADGNVIWIQSLSQVWEGDPMADADAAGRALENLSVAVDADDAISVSGTLQLDQHSAFLVKLEPTGELRYDVAFSGAAVVRANGVAVDRAGSSLVAGSFFGTWELGSARLATAPNGTASDAWVAKLSETGAVEWVKTFSGNGVGQGAAVTAVAADPDGNVIVAGMADGMLLEDEVLTRRDAASQVAFVAKLSPSGDKLWVYQTAARSAQFFALAADAHSNIWAGGEFDGELDFGSKPTLSVGHPDAFLFELRP